MCDQKLAESKFSLPDLIYQRHIMKKLKKQLTHITQSAGNNVQCC